MLMIRHYDAHSRHEVLMTIFGSDNYRSGICMAIIEIGRREKRIRRLARAHSANGNDRPVGSSLG